jgi:hypothetical protein
VSNFSDSTVWRSAVRRFLVIGVFALLAATVLQSSLAASSKKAYTATISTSTIPSGATASVTLTIANLSDSQALGSANVVAGIGPAPATSSQLSNADYAPLQGIVDPATTATMLELRNIGLAPGHSMTVTMNTTAPCAAGSYKWSVIAKQSNDFNGPPGNDFTISGAQPVTTVTGGCQLAFGTQPQSAVKGDNLTGTAYDSGGDPVTVSAIDGNGNVIRSATGTVTLALDPTSTNCTGASFSGTTDELAPTGTATFGSLLSATAGFDCRLIASASGYGSDTSDSFNISLVKTDCTGTGCPETSLGLDVNTNLTFSASGSFFQFLAVGPASIPAIVTAKGGSGGCANFKSISAAAFDEADGGGSGTKTFRYFVDKSIIPKQFQGTSGQQFLPICAGGARIDDGVVTPCTSADDNTGWISKVLDSQGKFTSAYTKAKCDPVTGLWWGILPSFQDITPGRIDPSSNPIVSNWGSSTTARWFDITVPSPWDWRAQG